MNKKYELLNENKVVNDITLHRIRALRDFGNVKAGDLGGWVESEAKLSHDGNCWVSGYAQVSGYAWVTDNAKVRGDAKVGI